MRGSSTNNMATYADGVLVYDTSNPVQVKERKTSAKRKREQEMIELKFLLSQRPFRDWVWKLLTRTKVASTISEHDLHRMAIHSGIRDVGTWILADILEADPDAYITMYKEFEQKDV